MDPRGEGGRGFSKEWRPRVRGLDGVGECTGAEFGLRSSPGPDSASWSAPGRTLIERTKPRARGTRRTVVRREPCRGFLEAWPCSAVPACALSRLEEAPVGSCPGQSVCIKKLLGEANSQQAFVVPGTEGPDWNQRFAPRDDSGSFCPNSTRPGSSGRVFTRRRSPSAGVGLAGHLQRRHAEPGVDPFPAQTSHVSSGEFRAPRVSSSGTIVWECASVPSASGT